MEDGKILHTENDQLSIFRMIHHQFYFFCPFFYLFVPNGPNVSHEIAIPESENLAF